MSKDIDPALFRETLGHYPTGVAAITAVADGRPVGMVVGTFSQVSFDPPLVAFLPTTGSKSFAVLRTATAFCVNVLASDQELLCRRFATAGDQKFDGVEWRPAPLGSPILDGAVSWIECTFEDVREAGDHSIVLGRVRDLAVERSTLPLLFFQGGYGRFSPGSFIAAPDPELIQAAQLAETMRSRVEDLAEEFEVNCSVLAKVRWDAVQVLAANHSPVDEPFPLGHRQPLIPPFGAVFMAAATDAEVDEWLGRARNHDEGRRALNRALLEKVRERGYSLLTAKPEVVARHQAVLSAFERSDGLPQQERVVRQVTSELADFFGPDIVPGERYDLANIVMLIATGPGLPPMALRITGLPKQASSRRIDTWIAAICSVAATAEQLTGSHR
ncbi:flavin reductase [uncultured Amnibacterium sp.]|uniref:flavin reductase n=1 Tax=uncultured Amnibacterium sp. TaxID=1631851 RepID=UPI0035CB7BA6